MGKIKFGFVFLFPPQIFPCKEYPEQALPGSSRSFGSYSLQLWDISPLVLVLASTEPSPSLPASQLLTRGGRDRSHMPAAIAAQDCRQLGRECFRSQGMLMATSLVLCDSCCCPGSAWIHLLLGSPASQGAAITQESQFFAKP